MDRAAISELVRQELANYRYDSPPPGTTIGVPWPESKILSYLEQLKACLVEPYPQRFELRDTVSQIDAAEPAHADYWVVAESSEYVEWFDPQSGEYGLGVRAAGRDFPVTIGVRGDLVGVFCAM